MTISETSLPRSFTPPREAIAMPTPPWLALLPLPTGLDPVFLAWLIPYVEARVKPGDDPHRHHVAARFAHAHARLHLAAARLADIPPGQAPDARWLRLEAQAQRVLTALDREVFLLPRRQPMAPPTIKTTEPSSAAPATSTAAQPAAARRTIDDVRRSRVLRRQVEGLGLPFDEADPFAALERRAPRSTPAPAPLPNATAPISIARASPAPATP
jgi:hypothetical protein